MTSVSDETLSRARSNCVAKLEGVDVKSKSSDPSDSEWKNPGGNGGRGGVVAGAEATENRRDGPGLSA